MLKTLISTAIFSTVVTTGVAALAPEANPSRIRERQCAFSTPQADALREIDAIYADMNGERLPPAPACSKEK